MVRQAEAELRQGAVAPDIKLDRMHAWTVLSEETKNSNIMWHGTQRQHVYKSGDNVTQQQHNMPGIVAVVVIKAGYMCGVSKQTGVDTCFINEFNLFQSMYFLSLRSTLHAFLINKGSVDCVQTALWVPSFHKKPVHFPRALFFTLP